MSTDEQTVTQAVVHLTGRVKWFNNKVGYGFITITDGENSGTDIFAHHSAINVENQQYKYLVQGEYVEFNLIKTQSEKHEYQASNIIGIKGGKLMCETRNELRQARTDYKNSAKSDTAQTRPPRMPRMSRQRYGQEQQEQDEQRRTMPRQRRHYSSRGGDNERTPYNGSQDRQDWTVVSRRRPYRPYRPRQPQQSTQPHI